MFDWLIDWLFDVLRRTQYIGLMTADVIQVGMTEVRMIQRLKLDIQHVHFAIETSWDPMEIPIQWAFNQNVDLHFQSRMFTQKRKKNRKKGTERQLDLK